MAAVGRASGTEERVQAPSEPYLTTAHRVDAAGVLRITSQMWTVELDRFLFVVDCNLCDQRNCLPVSFSGGGGSFQFGRGVGAVALLGDGTCPWWKAKLVSNFVQTSACQLAHPFFSKHHWRFHMMNPWFTISYQTARLGFDVQNAAALQFLRLVGGTSKTDVPDMIAALPDVQADAVQVDAAPPDVQVAATKLASDRGTRREPVNNGHKKRSRAKTTASALSKRLSRKNSASRKA